MALDRPLTRQEEAFMEQELLKLAQELQSAVAKIADQIDPEHQDMVERLRGAADRTLENIEAAIEVDADLENLLEWLKESDLGNFGTDARGGGPRTPEDAN